MKYKSFESYHPSRNDVPYHVSIIPDGARRWSKKNNVNLLDAYRHGMKNVSKIIQHLFEKGVQTISIYFASTQNFRRTNEEVSAFCTAETEFLNEDVYEILGKYPAKIRMAGLKNMLPDNFLTAINKLEDETKENSKHCLNFCIAYSSLDEIWQAAKKSNNEEEFLEKLWVTTPVDVMIRTDNSNIISNFLMLQSGFARLYFVGKLVNEVLLEDIDNILLDFSGIKKIYGE